MMKQYLPLGLLLIHFLYSDAQRKTVNEGDWSKQFVVLKNTKEADLMIRVGDIDNLNFGFEEHFNPFTGKSTDPHGYPWDVNKDDAIGTDRIMIPTSYKYESSLGNDGYTGSTHRPGNKPVAIQIPLSDLKGVKIDSAALQMFIDDFQTPEMGSKFQVTINGLRFTEAEKIISKIDQTGPVGKLITLRLTPELMAKLQDNALSIYIDDPVTGVGDGYAIDFVKLLINPRVVYGGKVRGTIIDAGTAMPIAGAMADIEGYGNATTDDQGNFTLENIPAGLNVVKGTASGYSSDEKQVDVIAGEESDIVVLELKPSEKVNYENKTLQEGDRLILKNIQFKVNSFSLLPEGKTELDKLVQLLQQYPTMEILLSGFTSSEGSDSQNRELSLKRVRSCKDYLTSKGIDESRITIKGLGPDQPIAPNDTEANRAINRRVEMKITHL